MDLSIMIAIFVVGFLFGTAISAPLCYLMGKEATLSEMAEKDQQAKAQVMWTNLMKMGGMKDE
jgi:hypothetical protein